MALVPSSLPLWAYVAAGGAAFVVAKAATAGAGTGPASSSSDANPDEVAAQQTGGAGSSLWDAFGGGGGWPGLGGFGTGQFGLGGGADSNPPYDAGAGGDSGGSSSGGDTGGTGSTGGGATTPPPAPAPPKQLYVSVAGGTNLSFFTSSGACYKAAGSQKISAGFSQPAQDLGVKTKCTGGSVHLYRILAGNLTGRIVPGDDVATSLR